VTPPGSVGGTLTLDLAAKKQELKKRLRFFATVSADSTLVARGKAIKKKATELAANQKTKVKGQAQACEAQEARKQARGAGPRRDEGEGDCDRSRWRRGRRHDQGEAESLRPR
jgi:hypothetical protein